MDEHQIKYRYERKFLITRNKLPKLFQELNSNKFFKAFPKRKINNLYFDSFDFTSLTENIEGLSSRKKFRVRWYGEAFKSSKKNIEIKFKEEFLNRKIRFDLSQLNLEDKYNFKKFHQEILDRLLSKKEYLMYSIFSSKIPTLLNSYERDYFINREKDIRITIDSKLNFLSPITKQKYSENNIIIEAKYSKQSEFLNTFKNLKLTRYSKYAKGSVQTCLYSPNY